MKQNPITSYVLIIGANLYVLAGFIFWDWNVIMVLLALWIESGLVGLFWVVRAAFSEEGVLKGRANLKPKKRKKLVWFALTLAAIWFLSGAFVVWLLIGSLDGSISLSSLMQLVEQVETITLFQFFFVVHANSLTNHLNGLRKKKLQFSFVETRLRAFQRVCVLHSLFILGTLFFVFIGAPRLFVAVFIVVKTIADVVMHRSEYAKRDTLFIKA